ncbi:Dual specificity protein phosphatase 22 [Trichuris trichiura]|uniref:Dual specificity protein phosphatase 22 n=1 Tax=Trichuris trichiura TaxID=36087 RepID=A0A077Z7L5_TRITR|nr:Dual specificity protein phosphatase 22 [Trichuris trichiura]
MFYISHIVSIHDRAKLFNDGRQQLLVKISDQESENILEHVSKVNDFIHAARLNGGSVLVHCMLGISRSVTFVIAYVMSVTDLGWREALKVVRSTRHRASPNFGFKRQLQAFEKSVSFSRFNHPLQLFLPSFFTSLSKSKGAV